jgi:hypothetical protein
MRWCRPIFAWTVVTALLGLVVTQRPGEGLAKPPAEGAAKPPSDGPAGKPPKAWVEFHKGDPQFPQATMRFGVVLAKVADPKALGRVKRLTYDPWGRTNNTCVKIDGDEFLFGQAPGKWEEREGKLGAGRHGLRSVWLYPDQKVQVTQTVEVVRGEQTGDVDTARVRYDIENKDTAEHTVGLRFMLDTFIGTNDGAPFILPGEKALCETVKDYRAADKVPPFAQALERLDFKGPGVVAHLKLKMGEGLEDPVRATFGGWPNPGTRVPGADGPMTKWSVPVLSMKQNLGGQQSLDSAATIYWAEKKMPAGGKRAVGFAYGLGNFNADEGGDLGLVLAGPFRAGAEMTVVALVKGPQEGQTATLKLPKGMELAGGEAKQKVPMPPAGSDGKISPVTWTVRTPEAGTFALSLDVSSGASLRQGVRINPAAGASGAKEKEKVGD